MSQLESTKHLKFVGSLAGLKKSEVSILREKKFVGKFRTNKGTLINLYETHDVTAHARFYPRLRTLGDEAILKIIHAIAEQGCEVCYYENTEGQISGIMYREVYLHGETKGRVRNISAEARYLEKRLKECETE